MVWEDDMKRGVEETTSQSLLHHLHEYRTGQVQDRFAVQLQVSEGSMTSFGLGRGLRLRCRISIEVGVALKVEA